MKDINAILQNLKWLETKFEAFIKREGLVSKFNESDKPDEFYNYFKPKVKVAIQSGKAPEPFVKDNFAIALLDFRAFSMSSPRCKESKFVLSDFTDGRNDSPLINSKKIDNLRRLHKRILVPIVNYYKILDPSLQNTCLLDVRSGLCSEAKVKNEHSGTIYSELLTGNGVIFGLNGVSRDVVIDDLSNRKIPINFGILHEARGGIFITNPLNMNNQTIENLLIKTLDGTDQTLSHAFV